jgi:hypothetical protein
MAEEPIYPLVFGQKAVSGMDGQRSLSWKPGDRIEFCCDGQTTAEESLMTRIAMSLTTLALVCVASGSHGGDLSTSEESQRSAKYDEVYQFSTSSLLAATLTKSKDLSKKGKSTYFCEYSSSGEPKSCDRMDTVSGQYEDYYQSQMACKQPCPGADRTQSSWPYIAGTKRICRDLATGSCEKVALTRDQVRDELIDLLQLEEKLSHKPASPREGQTARDRGSEQ